MNPNQGLGTGTGGLPHTPPTPAPQYPARPNVELSMPQRPVNVPLRDSQNATTAIQPQDLPQQPAANQVTQPYQPPTAPQTPVATPGAPGQANTAQPQADAASDFGRPGYRASAMQPAAYPAANALTQPSQAPAPIRPAPTQQLPPQPQEARNTPMPADVLPPQQVPPVPTLNPANPTPIDTPTINDFSAPLNPVDDSAAQPASVAPPAASFTPTAASHVPGDIADRITETPIQNSNDIAKKGQSGGGKFKGFLSFIVFIVSVLAAAFLINQFIFQSYYVEGTSMTPTLQNNDRLIISKMERTVALATGQPYIPKRGQIVVLDSSLLGPNGQHEQLIKRVIGLPGERVRIQSGTVTVFNAAHPEGTDITQELNLTHLQAAYTESPIDITIPQGQVYVMGDNRGENGSYDSRAFGPIEGDKIQGRLWARVLPLDKAQLY